MRKVCIGLALALAFAMWGATASAVNIYFAAPDDTTAPGGTLRRILAHEHPIESVDFSPDGRTVVSGSQARSMRIWDVDTGLDLRR